MSDHFFVPVLTGFAISLSKLQCQTPKDNNFPKDVFLLEKPRKTHFKNDAKKKYVQTQI